MIALRDLFEGFWNHSDFKENSKRNKFLVKISSQVFIAVADYPERFQESKSPLENEFLESKPYEYFLLYSQKAIKSEFT